MTIHVLDLGRARAADHAAEIHGWEDLAFVTPCGIEHGYMSSRTYVAPVFRLERCLVTLSL